MTQVQVYERAVVVLYGGPYDDARVAHTIRDRGVVTCVGAAVPRVLREVQAGALVAVARERGGSAVVSSPRRGEISIEDLEDLTELPQVARAVIERL